MLTCDAAQPASVRSRQPPGIVAAARSSTRLRRHWRVATMGRVQDLSGAVKTTMELPSTDYTDPFSFKGGGFFLAEPFESRCK